MKSSAKNTALLIALVLTGCGEKPTTQKTSEDSQSKSESVAEKTPPKSETPPKPPLEERLFGEHKLAAWPRVLKNLDPAGPDGASAVDGLMALVADEDVPMEMRTNAAISLGRIGSPAAKSVPLFVGLIQNPAAKDSTDRNAVTLFSLKTLEMLGPIAKDATPVLITVVKDSKRPTAQRAGALETLSRIGSANAKAVQTVIGMLRLRREIGVELHDYWVLRRAAADGVAMIGPDAFVAIPELIFCLRTSDRDLRRKSALALGAMRGNGRDAVVPLAEALTKDPAPEVRDAAAEGLSLLGPLAVPILRRILRNEEETADVRARVAQSLGKIGPPAKEAVDDLDFSLDDADPWVRLQSAEAIYRITDNPRSLVSMAIEEIKNPNRQVRMQAYRVFKTLGPKAKNAELGLNRLLKDDSIRYKTEIRKALQAIQQPR